MSWKSQFDASKALNISVVVVLGLVLIAYVVFQRQSGSSAHNLPQVRASDFESVVLKADTPVLVDFYADWCGPCKAMEPILAEFAHENPDVKVVQVNVDQNPELSQRFHINSIPHFMVFKKGELTAERKGSMDKKSLRKLIDQ